jgi:hypothetical protein
MVQIPIRDVATTAPAAAEAPENFAAELSEIVCPLTGEIADVKDADGLIDLFERLKEKNDAIYAAMLRCRTALSELTEGDAATRRVRGKRRAAKIEMPKVSFEQSVLKELWNSHPELAVEYLKIESIGVQMTPYKKLVNTTGTGADFKYFRDALTAACRGRAGTPSVTVEQ